MYLLNTSYMHLHPPKLEPCISPPKRKNKAPGVSPSRAFPGCRVLASVVSCRYIPHTFDTFSRREWRDNTRKDRWELSRNELLLTAAQLVRLIVAHLAEEMPIGKIL